MQKKIYSLYYFCAPQEKEQELEQLTKELRQVNLQQFIQQTGTKVTVLPAQPAAENYGMCTQNHSHSHIETKRNNIRIRFTRRLDLTFVGAQCPLVVAGPASA